MKKCRPGRVCYFCSVFLVMLTAASVGIAVIAQAYGNAKDLLIHDAVKLANWVGTNTAAHFKADNLSHGNATVCELTNAAHAGSSHENILWVEIVDTQNRMIAEWRRRPNTETSGHRGSFNSLSCMPVAGEIRVEQHGAEVFVAVPICDSIPSNLAIPSESASHIALIGDKELAYVRVGCTLAGLQAAMRQQVVLAILVGVMVLIVPTVVVMVIHRSAGVAEKKALPEKRGVLAKLLTAEMESSRYTDHELANTKAITEAVCSELQAANQELYETNQALEREVGEVNDLLAATEATTYAKSEFIALLSHKIRSPMSAIVSFADMLLDPALPEDQRLVAVNTIRRDGLQLVAIIDDMLDMASMEVGGLEVHHEICSLFQVIADVQSSAGAALKHKNVTFDVDYIGDIPRTIQTDPARLRQILCKLLDNAVKFTEVGGIRLVVQCCQDELEPVMQFEMIDTGTGIAHERLDDLFEPFQQFDDLLDRPGGSAGLSLSICKQLAAILGGDLTVDSMLDQGSTFRLTIGTGPLDDVEMVDGQVNAILLKQDKQADGAAQLKSKLRNARILLAEEGSHNQELIAMILHKADCRVEFADNGQIAVDMVMDAIERKQPYDLILMAMQMPVLDGYNATSQLRHRGCNLPIIALTAHAMAGNRENCLKAGCDDYVTRPIDPLKLIDTVQQWVGTTSARMLT